MASEYFDLTVGSLIERLYNKEAIDKLRSSIPIDSVTVSTITPWTDVIANMPAHSGKFIMANITSGVFTGSGAPSGWQLCFINKYDSNTNYCTYCWTYGSIVNFKAKQGVVTSTNAWTAYTTSNAAHWG